MSRVESAFQGQFRELTSKNFVAQAKWYMNGFWDEIKDEAENFWKWTLICAEISKNKAKTGELDEFEAHRFLEQLGETLTVSEMREKLKVIDVDFNKQMALVEYLIFKYNKTVKEVVSAPQGGQEEMKQAQALVDISQSALDEVMRQLTAQKEALAEQKKAEEDAVAASEAAQQKEVEARVASDNATRQAIAAKDAESDAHNRKAEAESAQEILKQAEDASIAAAEEQRLALKELKDIEDANNAKIKELEEKSNDGPVVQRGRAKAELEQLKSADSLPLRRAKINQEAAVRRFEKAKQRAVEEAAKAATAAAIAATSAKLATEARASSEIAAQNASQAAHSASMAACASLSAAQNAQNARLECEKIADELEKSVAECNTKLDEAMNFLNEVKRKPGQANGDIWWMQRELTEKMKYLPQSQQRK